MRRRGFDDTEPLISVNSEVDSRPKAGNTGVQVYFTIVNGFVGGGLLGLPYGFLQGGLFASIVLLLLLAIICNYTLKLLADIKICYDDGKTIKTYADIGRECFGTLGVVMVNAGILLSQLGYCSVYLVFIGDNLGTLAFLPHHFTSWQVLIVLILPIVCLLTWIRKIKWLSPTSFASNLAILVSIAAVLQFGFTHEQIKPLSDYAPFLRIKTLSIFYGIVCFAFVQHGLILEVHASMRDPVKYNTVLNLAMLFTTVIYLVFGILGYLFFGEDTNQTITKNLGDSVEADIIKLCLCLVLMFGYPLQMFPVTGILESALFGEPQPRTVDTLKRNAFRLFMVCLTIGAALGVPLFGLFASLVGCFSNSFIAFIFPTIFYLKLFWKDGISPSQLVICILILIIGILGMGIGSSVVIAEIISKL